MNALCKEFDKERVSVNNIVDTSIKSKLFCRYLMYKKKKEEIKSNITKGREQIFVLAQGTSF